MRHEWRRRAVIAAIIFFALLVIFHRPVLLTIIRRVAQHSATKEKLQATFRLQGSVFTNLAVRNLHVVPIGPSPVESIDVDFAHVDYSLFSLFRHRDFLRNVELRSARVVLNPAKALPPPRLKKPPSKPELPQVFPNRLQMSDVTLVIRNKPHDLVIEHVDLSLNPATPGELRIGQLQLPTSQTWSRISAKTSYANRNLILQNVALTDQDRIRTLQIDASRLNAKTLSMKLDLGLGGGTLSGSATLTETRSSLDTKVHFLAEGISADALNKYAALPENFLAGDIHQLIVDGTGILDVPRSWNGTVAARLNDFHAGAVNFDRCVLDIVAAGGTATLKSAEIDQGDNHFHLNGTSDLPEKLKDLGRTPAVFEFTAKTPDLRPITRPLGEEISGSAEASGKIEIKDAELHADASVATGPLKFAAGSMDKMSFNLKASKKFKRSTPTTPWFEDLESKTTLAVTNVRYQDYLLDSIDGEVVGAGDSLKFDQLTIRRKQNQLIASGRYVLPADFNQPSKSGTIEFSLSAPELADFWVADARDKWSGPLNGEGQLEWRDGVGNGQITVSGANLRTRDLVLNEVSLQSTLARNVFYLNDFTSRLDQQDFVAGHGTIDLSAGLRYNGKFAANLSDLSKLTPLLRAGGNNNELAGALSVTWDGSGDRRKLHGGNLKLTLRNGRYGNLKSLQANVDANYSPDGLNIPTIFVQSDRMDFQAIVQAKGETLEITKIQLDQGQAKYASGYISVPFVWKNVGTDAPLFPSNGKVLATFESANIDIKKVFEDFGAPGVVSGMMNAKLQAQGTFSNLDAQFDLEMKDLRNQKFPNLEPATFTLNARAKQSQLTISGKLQQAKIQPAELTAKIPLDVPRILLDKQLPDNTPVVANLRLPRSSVNFLRQFIPAIQELDGDMAIDVNVNGTMGRPVLKGNADMTINVARANDPTLPALQNFKARLNFADNALTLEQFGGELSGGKITATGKVTFPKLTEPNLDLQLRADSALIMRNDTLTARTDADIRCTGPFNRASVTGTVAVTNSHVLKNLDLIPIGLPGRPAPQPPEEHPEISFPNPPLRDWTFNIAIKTKDPVLLRGSLASGGALIDLHFGGSGLHPELQGTVRLENVEATLPFSRLEIANGFLYFDPSDPLNPKIDLHGTSVLHDHTIHVYIYGTILAPQAIFSSEPPLPQEEIISLLATGTTREELTGNNNVLAGRAAMLLVQQLYRKVFKKGEGTQSSSVFDRLDLDVGTVDPRTGQQQAIARFKINDQFVVVGDVGVGGDYRGMVKYLIRFH